MRCKWAVVAIAVSVATGGRAEVINVDNAELARLMATGVPLIDIRTAGEWTNGGVIPGSRLLTFFDEAGNADPSRWLDAARALGGPTKPVILICRSGNRTRAASEFLSSKAGYRVVYNVTRGISAWAADGRTMVPAAPSMRLCAPGIPGC